jgi:hypothetical protein
MRSKFCIKIAAISGWAREKPASHASENLAI